MEYPWVSVTQMGKGMSTDMGMSFPDGYRFGLMGFIPVDIPIYKATIFPHNVGLGCTRCI
jgi:hypothetical protein